MRTNKAVVAYSGGQDSTTCLFWAIDKFGKDNVYPVCFDYGQKHKIEIQVAKNLCNKINLPLKILTIETFLQLGSSALTNDAIEINKNARNTGNHFAEEANLPSTFVPGRNLIFLGLLTAYAAQLKINNIVTGVCYADEVGYPDCRPDFIKSFEETANKALGINAIKILTPLLFLNKAQTFQLAQDLGVLESIIFDTHTCYNGNRELLHSWGYGCNECTACNERQNGWTQFNLAYGVS